MSLLKKTIPLLLYFFAFVSVFAFEAGFDIQNSMVFLEKESYPNAPEVISTTRASLFCTFDFSIKNNSFLVEPGMLLHKNTVLPFFRRLCYSCFTDTLFFSIGKNTFSFGEGNIKNCFFVHVPQAMGRKKEISAWHGLIEIPVKQFLFTAGGFCDSSAPDRMHSAQWYALWAKAVYSHPVISAGMETDIVLQPAHVQEKREKAAAFTAAMEVSAVLPYEVKLYTNAQLPIDLLRKCIADWGVLAGVSKSFVFTDITLSSIAEAAYSQEGFSYGVFQSTMIHEYVHLLVGMQGLKLKNIIGIMESEFSIADFKLKCTYTTKNLIQTNREKKSGSPYTGVLSITACLGGR